MAKKGSSGNRLRAKYQKYRNIMKKRQLEAQKAAAKGGQQAPPGAPVQDLAGVVEVETSDLVDFSEELDELSNSLETTEGVCKMAIRTLMDLITMPFGVIYLLTDDETQLKPRLQFGSQEDSPPLSVDREELAAWLQTRDCTPFSLAAVRYDDTFLRVFPDSRIMLEVIRIRLAIPFVTRKRLMGMAYFGGISEDAMTAFEDAYRDDIPFIRDFSHDIAVGLYEVKRKKGPLILGMWDEVDEDWLSEEEEEEADEDDLKEILEGGASDQELMEFLKNKFMGGKS